ncbi:hypothetical protein KY349_05070 [Candidatus Woesearchaeota archaeon]|nr:hypothetical protein [Candidatus Woesearchaeota archaeon]
MRHRTLITIVGTVTGALLLGGEVYALSPTGSIQDTLIGAGAGAPLGTVITQSGLALKDYFKRPVRDCVKGLKFLRAVPSLRRDNIQKRRAAVENIRPHLHENKYLEMMAGLDLLEGNLESALDKYEEVFAMMPDTRYSRSAIKRYALWKAERRIKKYRTDVDPFINSMHLAVSYQGNGYFEKALEHWEDVLRERHEDIDVNILYGRALEAMHKEEMAMEQWQNVLHLVRAKAAEEKRITFEQIEKTDVWRLKESEILDNVFVFKRSENEETLRDEFETTEKARKRITEWSSKEDLEDKVAAARSLRVAKNDSYALVSLHEKGTTLHEYVEETGDHLKLNEAARFLGAIHSLMDDSKGEPRNEELHFLERMNALELKFLEEGKDTLEYKEALTLLLGSCSLPIDKIKNSPEVFDKDAHGSNWNISEDGRLTSIDFQRKNSVKLENELSKLMERGSYFANTPRGDTERDRCLLAYTQELSEHGKIEPFSFRETAFRKLNADLLRAASFFSFSYGNEAERKIRLDYLRNAIHSADRLQKPEFKDKVTTEERAVYQMFQKGLNRLLMLG